MDESTPRLYKDLAWLWRLWGDPAGEYAVWCDHVARLIGRYGERPARSLLNMGCGGGKNAFNLKRRFEVTGLDISRPMLDLAAELNPECGFVQADMRTCELGRLFDAVLIDDAVSYMASRGDLRAVFEAAWRHLHPGGVMVVAPDDTTETFRQNRTGVTHAEKGVGPGDVDVVFIDNSYDPDPDDETYEGTMVYLIRENGRLRVETDVHVLGLFPLAVWREQLGEVGYTVHEEALSVGGVDVVAMACVRPA